MPIYTKYQELIGELRYRIFIYSEDEEDCVPVAGPFTEEECVEFIRTNRKAAEAPCYEVWTYDMAGYEAAFLWDFLVDQFAQTWMKENGYKMESPMDYQLKLMEG